MGSQLQVHNAQSKEAGHTEVMVNTAKASPSMGQGATPPAYSGHRMQSKSKKAAPKTTKPSESRPQSPCTKAHALDS